MSAPERYAAAARNLLSATENAATRGDFELARIYANKASEAMRALRAATTPARRMRNSERIS